MLVIISDIHLGDGTCGKSISPHAFQLFTSRIKELACYASNSKDRKFQPVESIDIILLGDILDVLHSNQWVEKDEGQAGYVRPWTDFRLPEFASKVGDITRAILKNNQESISILRRFQEENISVSQALKDGSTHADNSEVTINVNLHYMVGNHDWYYHLPGPQFDRIRSQIVEAFGLSNPPGPFPHQLNESTLLTNLLADYKVFARHGDIYDPFCYNREKGRDAAAIGDVFSVEMINRFPGEVEQSLGDELPPPFIESLRELANVRPTLAVPLWISSQLNQNRVSAIIKKKIKKLWDEMSREFLKLNFIRESNHPFKLEVLDELELMLRLTDRISFNTLDSLVAWMRKRVHPDLQTFARHALKEEAFLDQKVHFIIYGHTHHHELVPLDSLMVGNRSTSQMYINSGTWHPYYDLAINKPEEQKFILYQVMTYLSFFKENECQGRRFETWSGAFSD
jgi:UDP-2,3-diacylglucosamine pyrophosphatase LpxH